MEDKAKILKRFLRQKSVLDTLRSQMDVSGGLLTQLQENGVLLQDDMDKLQVTHHTTKKVVLTIILDNIVYFPNKSCEPIYIGVRIGYNVLSSAHEIIRFLLLGAEFTTMLI